MALSLFQLLSPSVGGLSAFFCHSPARLPFRLTKGPSRGNKPSIKRKRNASKVYTYNNFAHTHSVELDPQAPRPLLFSLSSLFLTSFPTRRSACGRFFSGAASSHIIGEKWAKGQRHYVGIEQTSQTVVKPLHILLLSCLSLSVFLPFFGKMRNNLRHAATYRIFILIAPHSSIKYSF